MFCLNRMHQISHTAFYLTHDADKQWLIDEIMGGTELPFSPFLRDMKAELFSNPVLENFITEEIRHDHFEIATYNRHSLAASSTGEQRKALLNHIMAQKPELLVVDNVFESLDLESREKILSGLKGLAENTLVLQVFNRRSELLPFIECVYQVSAKGLGTALTRQRFMASFGTADLAGFAGSIPPPLTLFPNPGVPLVSMAEVSVKFGERPILDGISWQINPGEFWQLRGPNGSGKSTLLSLITGNSSKGYGQNLVLFGQKKGSGETVWDIKQKIGYFTPSMTLQFERQDSIEQMVISGFFDSVGLYLKPSDRQVQLAREWLQLIGLYEVRQQAFIHCPEAQQRMILVARAMIKHPPLLILDEPTAGLDDEMVVLFTALINKIAKETATAILYVSHRVEAGLTPTSIYELIPFDTGSAGRIMPL